MRSVATMSSGKSGVHSTMRSRRPGWTKARRSVSGWLVDAHHQRVLHGDGAVEQVEQEIHHRADREVGPAGPDLLGLRELELVEEDRQRRHLPNGLGPARHQLADLGAAVDHLEHEARHRHGQERGARERRQRAGQQPLARRCARRSAADPSAGACPSARRSPARSRRRRRSGSPPSPRRARRCARARTRAATRAPSPAPPARTCARSSPTGSARVRGGSPNRA